MKHYFFVRSVPLLVGVEAESENEAWTAAGRRVDDFMTDAVEMVPKWNHENEGNPLAEGDYILEYHGDAIYPRMVEELRKRINT